MDRILRDHLERTQAELTSAVKATNVLHAELAAARNRIAVLEAVVEAQSQAAKAQADVRDLLGAAMTTKFQAVPSTPASYGAIATVLLIGFVLVVLLAG